MHISFEDAVTYRYISNGPADQRKSAERLLTFYMDAILTRLTPREEEMLARLRKFMDYVDLMGRKNRSCLISFAYTNTNTDESLVIVGVHSEDTCMVGFPFLEF